MRLWCRSVIVFHLISLSSSSTFPYVRTLSFVDERSWVARSTKTHQRGLFTSNPPAPPRSASVMQPPSSLLQRWAGTPAAAPAEARLLFKAALSFHLFPHSASFSFFFFPADVNRVASQSFMPLWNTPHLENHKNQQRERKEKEQNKMGTAMAWLPPPLRFLASRKTPFQSFPDF